MHHTNFQIDQEIVYNIEETVVLFRFKKVVKFFTGPSYFFEVFAKRPGYLASNVQIFADDDKIVLRKLEKSLDSYKIG